MPTGTRITANNVFGTTTDNPLTNVSTTMNSAGLANLPAVSSNHAVLVLDPLRVAGAPEIVVVTAHTGAATSATVTRGAYGTSARQHASGTAWIHGATIDDVIRILTSSTRPSDPYQGQFIYETDTDSYVGRGAGPVWQTVVPLGAWSTYTPTLTQSATVTKTVTYARWVRIGRTIHFAVKLTVTGSGTASNAVRVGLPASCVQTSDYTLGQGYIFDSSASLLYRGLVTPAAAAEVFLSPTHVTTANVLGATAFTDGLGSNDIVVLAGTFEATS